MPSPIGPQVSTWLGGVFWAYNLSAHDFPISSMTWCRTAAPCDVVKDANHLCCTMILRPGPLDASQTREALVEETVVRNPLVLTSTASGADQQAARPKPPDSPVVFGFDLPRRCIALSLHHKSPRCVVRLPLLVWRVFRQRPIRQTPGLSSPRPLIPALVNWTSPMLTEILNVRRNQNRVRLIAFRTLLLLPSSPGRRIRNHHCRRKYVARIEDLMEWPVLSEVVIPFQSR